MSAYMGTKSMVTHKQIPHHMPSKAGTFSHWIPTPDGRVSRWDNWRVKSVEFLVNKICAGPSDPYLDNSSLEEMSIKKFLQLLVLQIRDIDTWNNMPISNMDLEDGVLQGMVNCSCFPCIHQIISASLPFLHTHCWRQWVVCINCRMRWK